MSHFTHIKTCFQNLLYLQKALDRLNIQYEKKSLKDSDSSNFNLVIAQTNGYNLEFSWNGQEYALIVDISFWEQPYSIDNFIDKIAQQYAGEVIICESQKMGFKPVKYHQNSDGSNTVVLERWKNEN